MASIRKRTKKDGTTSSMVCWRDPASSKEQGITFATEAEAVTLKRLLDANKQSFEIAQHAMVKNQTKSPTVAAVIQEHIDLLVRPSVGTVHTYQTMLKPRLPRCVPSAGRPTRSPACPPRRSDQSAAGQSVFRGKFLLGLKREGIHVAYALSVAERRPDDELPYLEESSRAYVGMLGEDF